MAVTEDLSAALASMNAAIQGVNNTAAAQTAALNSIVATFNGRIAAMEVAVYVNQATGDDGNAGTIASPVKTLARALAMTPPGGVCRAKLQAAYNVAADVFVDNRILVIESDGSTRWAVTFERYTLVSGGTTYRSLRGFKTRNRSRIVLFGLSIQMPTVDGIYTGLALLGGTGLIADWDYVTGGGTLIAIGYCDLPLPGTMFCPIVGKQMPMTLYTSSLVVTGGSLNGWWVAGVTATAGTATSGLQWLLTDLATI